MSTYKEIVGQKITKVTSDPSDPKTGQMWYNETTGSLRALAIVEALKFFHRFIAGRTFTILTDHRPLHFIFNSKPVSDRISARLQR